MHNMPENYIPSRVNQFSDRLNSIVQSKNKGQVLYRYRIDKDEFEQLQSYLKGFEKIFYNPDRVLKYTCSLDMHFVLYAAEWWRRCYQGEWSWKGILDSINVKSDEISSQTLVNIVENGLRKWQRTILRDDNNRRYALGSIAREGGLPIHYLTDGKGGWIERLLSPALEYKAITGDSRFYIESNKDLIPKSYGRLQIIETFVELVDDIYQLIQSYQLDTQTDPVKYLNGHVPNWDERFPFPLEAEAAQSMLQNLIVESVKQERRAKSESNKELLDGWQEHIQLKRLLSIDCASSEVELLARIISPYALPLSEESINKIEDYTINIDFNAQSDDTEQGHWSSYPVHNQQRLKIDERKEIKISETYWHDGIVMKVSGSTGQLINELEDKQGNSLNPYQNTSMYEVSAAAPFLAEIINDNDSQDQEHDLLEEITAEYIGSYSQRTGQRRAVVYIPTEADIEVEPNSEITKVGDILKGSLYILVGSVLVKCDDNKFKLKTKSKDASYSYELIGQRLLDFEYPSMVFKNRSNKRSIKIKQVNKANSDDWREVPENRIKLAALGLTNKNLEFKTIASYQRNELVGCFRLQVLDDELDSVVFQQTIGLVPDDFEDPRLIPLSNDGDKLQGVLSFSTDHSISLNVRPEYVTKYGIKVNDGAQKNDFVLTANEVPTQQVAFELSFNLEDTKSCIRRPVRRCYHFPQDTLVIYDKDETVLEQFNNSNAYRSRPFNINESLYGYRIKVYNSQLSENSAAVLEFALQSDSSSKVLANIPVKKQSFLELQLYKWVDTLRHLLSFSQKGLDDEVRVRLYIRGGLRLEMRFCYYDFELKPNIDEQVIELKVSRHLPATENFDNPELYDCYQNINLRAINLRRPDHNAKSLIKTNRHDSFTWAVDSISKESGTWLLYAEAETAKSDDDEINESLSDIQSPGVVRGNLKPQIRSTVWIVADKPNVSGLDKEVRTDECSLKKASSVASFEERQGMIAKVLSEMAFDINHVGWSYMKGLTEACIDLPLVTLDNWQMAKKVPEFMCAVVVFGDELLSTDIVKKVTSEIGFIWELIKIEDLSIIWEKYCRFLEDSIDATDKQQVDKRIESKKEELANVSYVFDTFFSSTCVDAQPYTKGIIEFELKPHLESLFNRKQQAEERWPDSKYLLSTINAFLFKEAEEYDLNISQITVNHSFTQSVAKLPVALAWLSVYGNTSDEAKELTNKLLAKPLLIYDVKQFAPHWFEESYHLLVCWFSYCRNRIN